MKIFLRAVFAVGFAPLSTESRCLAERGGSNYRKNITEKSGYADGL